MATDTTTDVITEEKEYSLSGGKFFEAHPEKILAEPYEASGRFGKVTKYKPKGGTTPLEVLKEIQTPVFIGHGITDVSAGMSVIKSDPEQTKFDESKALVDELLKKAIELSKADMIKTQRSKKRDLLDFNEPSAKPTIPFEDILRNYNPGLSQDEIKAFLWYMHHEGNTYRGKWLNVFNPSILSQEQESAYLNAWVKSGILFYFKGDLLPAFIYFSENIYDRKEQLEKDKSNIISIYGQEAYSAQELKVREAFEEIYANRLKLDNPVKEQRLHLKPYGDFSESITIKNWNLNNETQEPKPFLLVTNAKGIFWESKKTQLSEWKDKKRDELSIADAFRWWLKHDANRPTIGNNFNWEDIFKYYLDKKNVKNIDPTVLARNRALAKRAADDLFSKFLAEIILENDRVKIERVWNETYNAGRGIRTEKIPIAFECALSYWNEPIEIRPEKREAVAFASYTGSYINAYQVGVGKASLLTSDILTPKGWVKMKDIKAGMDVIAKNGKPTKVLKVFPQGTMPAYRVTMSDGSFTEVTGDHFWNVQNLWDRYTGNWRLMTTLEMAKKLYNQRNDRIYSIPMVEPVQFEHKDVPIDPYLLGALIGDGGLTTDVSFSNPEIEIQDKIRKIVESYHLSFTPELNREDIDFRITRGSSQKKRNVILDSLRELGLMGKKSIDKFIPDLYLYNSIDVRLALLQGIMDTDGFVDKTGYRTGISTSSIQLAKDITQIIRSLGGTVGENVKHPKFTYKGEVREGHEAYILSVRLPAHIIPFTTKKHLDRYKPKTKYKPVRFINSIEPIGKHEAQCIRVEDPEHLYVCDDYIVTHNTPSACFTIAQFLDAGHCERPFLVVPNQVYKQFYSEMKGLLPNRKINDLYNMSKDYYNSLLDENGKIQMVDKGSITMLTYEGFERIGFSQATADNLLSQLRSALIQIQEYDTKAGQKQGERDAAKIEGILGRALQSTSSNIEELGFDFVCFDEAHALKNIFASVKSKRKKGADQDKDSDEEGTGARGKKRYEISGSVSTRGIKAYMLCSYIQSKNRGRNVMLLTATPFTNSPLEIYSMLSLVGYTHLKKIGLANINDFFDNYCQMSYELIINSKLQPIRKEIFKAFDNLVSLQKLVYKFMLHKEAGKPDSNGNVIALVRPDKWLLPYKGRFNERNEFIPATADQLIDTVLPLTEEQKNFMEEIISYVEGGISYSQLQSRGASRIAEMEDDEDEIDMSELSKEEKDEIKRLKKEEKENEDVIDEGEMDDEESAGVKTLRGVNFARSLSLSPYLYEFSGLGTPDYKNYVEKSPKLLYVMGCVRSVKTWHESKKQPISGQIIYMDRGKKYFNLIKDYLVAEIGYKEHEVGIIRSGKEGSAKHKDFVKNSFNGEIFNEGTKSFDKISDDKRIKIILGTSSIREGLNLNKFSTVLYNAFVDWNPTDQIQLEGRLWRQGNTFENVRIVIPLMADSMDIFMFEKLQQKTERINSIWNHDGTSNVLKVEELDPKEQKERLITNPRIIAELQVEKEETSKKEEMAGIESLIETGRNVMSFFSNRDKHQKELIKVLSVIEPERNYVSIETMQASFEKMLVKQQEDTEFRRELQHKILSVPYQERYSMNYITTMNNQLYKHYTYGTGKGAVAMLKKAKTSFLDKHGIQDNREAVQGFIDEQNLIYKRLAEDVERLKSDEYLNEMAMEIEEERKRKKIKVVSLESRVKEFETLNYLLDLMVDKNISQAESYIYTQMKGCPPMTKDGKADISPEGVKKLEACIEKIPQTKELHVDSSGKYTDKREKLHKNIRAKLMAGLSCRTEREKPIAILMAGVPGAGKSSFLKKYAPNLEKEKIFKIDADEIRSMLPEYQGWNSKATHKETQDIYRGLLQDVGQGKPCKFDILWDGTMNKAANYLPLIGDLKALNYEIFMICLTVPWDVSKKRTLERYAHAVDRGEKGRYVPMAVVDEANQNGLTAFNELKFKADGYMVVDGVTQKIIDQGGKNLLADRGYFDKEPTEKDALVKTAKAKSLAMKQRIRILKLKEE